MPLDTLIVARLDLHGESLLADPAGVLFWPSQSLLAVADLHLEKGSSFARRRIFLPPYDTAATLNRLQAALARYAPRRVVALGDTFHDASASERLTEADRARIKALTAAHDWLWLTGNHDPAPPKDIGGDSAAEAKIGALTFTHEPTAIAGTVAGHLHPCATVKSHGRRVRRRCFATDGARLVLPSFGAFTGGLCVLDPAFAPVLPGAFTAILLGERPYTIPHSRLVADKAA